MAARKTPNVLSRLNRRARVEPEFLARISGDVQIAAIQGRAADILADLFAALRPSDGASLAAIFRKRKPLPATTGRWLGYLRSDVYETASGGPAGPYQRPVHRVPWERNARQFRERVLDVETLYDEERGMRQPQ